MADHLYVQIIEHVSSTAYSGSSDAEGEVITNSGYYLSPPTEHPYYVYYTDPAGQTYDFQHHGFSGSFGTIIGYFTQSQVNVTFTTGYHLSIAGVAYYVEGEVGEIVTSSDFILPDPVITEVGLGDTNVSVTDAEGNTQTFQQANDPLRYWPSWWYDLGAVTQRLFTEGADSRNFNTLDPTDFTFESAKDALGGNDVVVLPDTLAKWKGWGISAVPMFLAGAGNDTITGGELGDKIDGGAGNDTLTGSAGDDILTAGTGNDVIHGGADDDTVILAGSYRSYKVTELAAKKGEPPSVQLVRGSEVDRLDGVEFLQFSDYKVPIADWHFEFHRSPGGNGPKSDHSNLRIDFFVNGEKVASTASYPKYLSSYDDATPIPAGDYHLAYRTDRNGGSDAFEFLDAKGRKAIQVHQGNFTGDSEGCYVGTGAFMKKVLAVIQPETEESPLVTLASGGHGYKLPDFVMTGKVIDDSGTITQPYVTLSSTSLNASKKAATLDVDMHSVDGNKISKDVEIVFKYSGATEKEFTVTGGKVDSKAHTITMTLDHGLTNADDLKITRTKAAKHDLDLDIIDVNLFRPSDHHAYAENVGQKGTLFHLFTDGHTKHVDIDLTPDLARHAVDYMV